MYPSLELGSMNIWCESENDWLKAKGCGAHIRKTNFAPSWPKIDMQSAKN